MTTDQTADQLKDAPEYPPSRWPELYGETADFDRRMWGVSWLSFQQTDAGLVVHADESGRGKTWITVDREGLVRWCREVLAALGENTGQGQLPEWRPVTDGQGKRPWYLARYSGDDDMRVPQGQRYYYGAASGNLVRYASQRGAQMAADVMNAAEGWTRDQQDIEAVTENWRRCRICGDSWDGQPLDRCPSTHRHPLTQVKQAG